MYVHIRMPYLNVYNTYICSQDPTGEIKRLSHFLGKSCDEELANQIAEKCSFQNLKLASETVKTNDILSNSLYRKGKTYKQLPSFTNRYNMNI